MAGGGGRSIFSFLLIFTYTRQPSTNTYRGNRPHGPKNIFIRASALPCRLQSSPTLISVEIHVRCISSYICRLRCMRDCVLTAFNPSCASNRRYARRSAPNTLGRARSLPEPIRQRVPSANRGNRLPRTCDPDALVRRVHMLGMCIKRGAQLAHEQCTRALARQYDRPPR